MIIKNLSGKKIGMALVKNQKLKWGTKDKALDVLLGELSKTSLQFRTGRKVGDIWHSSLVPAPINSKLYEPALKESLYLFGYILS